MSIKKITKFGFLLGLTMLAQSVTAITISTIPSATSLGLGQSLQVDLVVSGLHDLGGFPDNEIVSAFDLGVGFDNSVITPTGIVFGDGGSTPFGDSWLGDGLFDSFRDSNLNFDYVNANLVNAYIGPAFSQAVELSELSLLAAIDLQQVQPDSFILGSIFFDTVGLGSSGLSIIDDRLYENFVPGSDSGLLDVKGLDGANALITTLNDGSITVTSAVPVPSAVWLFGTSIFGLIGFYRKKYKV